MLSSESLVKLKKSALEQWLEFDPDLYDLDDGEFDVSLLYAAHHLARAMVYLADIVSEKVEAIGVKGADKLPLDMFLSDVSIWTGRSFFDIRSQIHRDLARSPFSSMEMDYDEFAGKYEDSLTLELDAPALGDLAMLHPEQYDDCFLREFNFCTSHLRFFPRNNMHFDGNVAQTGFIPGVRNILTYFQTAGIPFALFASGECSTEYTVIGGLHGNRSYRVNPNHSPDLQERVWLNVVSQMLPRYS